MSTNNNSLYAFWHGRLCIYTTRLRSGLGFLVSYSTLATLALPRLKLGVRSVVLSYRSRARCIYQALLGA